MVTGIIIHGIFALLGLIPEGARSLQEMATFAIDHTFWLNVVSITVVAVMFVLTRRAKRRMRAGAHS